MKEKVVKKTKWIIALALIGGAFIAAAIWLGEKPSKCLSSDDFLGCPIIGDTK